MWQNNILSGPLTHKFNTISNLTNGPSSLGILCRLEGLYSGGVPGMRDALAVWKGTLPGISRGLANAGLWVGERGSALGHDRVGPEVPEGVDAPAETLAASGVSGSVPRIGHPLPRTSFPWRLGRDAGCVYGLWYRPQEGLKGDALTKRMQELQADPHSDAWLDNDEIVGEYLFQEKLGDVGRAVVNLRNNIPGLRYIIPFVSTNVNVAKRVLVSPLALESCRNSPDTRADRKTRRWAPASQPARRSASLGDDGHWMLDDEEDPLISGRSGKRFAGSGRTVRLSVISDAD